MASLGQAGHSSQQSQARQSVALEATGSDPVDPIFLRPEAPSVLAAVEVEVWVLDNSESLVVGIEHRVSVPLTSSCTVCALGAVLQTCFTGHLNLTRKGAVGYITKIGRVGRIKKR